MIDKYTGRQIISPADAIDLQVVQGANQTGLTKDQMDELRKIAKENSQVLDAQIASHK